MSRWYDKAGKEISMMEAARLHGDFEYVIVAREYVGEKPVSTVWLALDHRHWDDGAPLIFETLVFNRGATLRDSGIMERYSTEVEAKAGHARIVAELKAGVH